MARRGEKGGGSKIDREVLVRAVARAEPTRGAGAYPRGIARAYSAITGDTFSEATLGNHLAALYREGRLRRFEGGLGGLAYTEAVKGQDGAARGA